MKTILLTSLIVAMAVGVATAETHVWSYPNIPLGEPITVDLGAGFAGVVSVEVHMAGFGGGQHGYCQDMDGGYPQNFPLYADVDLEGASATFDAPYMEDYDATFPLVLVDQPDWSFLEDGQAVLEIGYGFSGSYDYVDCYATGYDDLTTDTFEIIVTAGTVPVETTTLTTLKALYR